MISNEQLETELSKVTDIDHIKVSGDGYHYQITVVTDVFKDKAKVARQQWVYALLNEHITTGSLHAVNLKTYTNAEWEDARG